MNAPRPAAMAGRFYPSDPTDLADTVDGFLAAAAVAPDDRTALPKALIAPHAGYPYSGAVAGVAYARLADSLTPDRRIDRVVMFAPAHRYPVHGLAVPSAPAFDTPLGAVALDDEALQRARRHDGVHVIDEAHEMEHAIEVQLPFLQRCLRDHQPEGFRLAPFAVGDATPAQVAAVMDDLWGGPETLVVVSSDLSHFLDAVTAGHVDGATSAAIEALAPDRLGEGSACGRVSIQALLMLAARRGLTARAVARRTSADAGAGRDRVVGYGAYVIG